VDPRVFISKLSLWGTIVLLTVVGKFAIWTTVVRLCHHPTRVAFLVGIGLTQIGEFSYVLVRVARDAQLLGDDFYHATLAASVVTIVLNGLLFRAMPKISNSINRANPDTAP
jgi:K+:H+ antiporter